MPKGRVSGVQVISSGQQPVYYNLGRLDVPGQRVIEGFRQEGRKTLYGVGGVRGGKSWYGRSVVVDWSIRLGGLGWIVIPEYSFASELVRLINGLLYQHPEVVAEHREHPFPRWRLKTPGGAEFEIRSSYDPDTLAASTLTWGWMDEAPRQSRFAYLNLKERLLSTGGPMLLTGTPKGKNWFYHDIHLPFMHGDPTVGGAVLKTKDNPHISKEAYEELLKKVGAGSQYALQELEAEFVTFEGLVYATFDSELDVVAPSMVPQIPRLYLGVDWGSADPLAILVLGRHEGTWFLIDEFYQSHVSLDELTTILQGFRTTYPNIARGWMSWERPEIAQLLRGRGLPIMCAHKEDIGEGIAYIDSLFRERKVKVVAARCPNTMTELGQYQYPSFHSGDRKPGERPIDRDNHSMDAMRMAIRSEVRFSFTEKKEKRIYVPENPSTAY